MAITLVLHLRVDALLALALQPQLVLQFKDYYMNIHEWDEEEYERPMTRCKSARAPRTPRTPRAMSPRRRISGIDEEERRVMRNNEKNRRPSTARLASARDPPRSAYSRNSSSILNRPAFTVY